MLNSRRDFFKTTAILGASTGLFSFPKINAFNINKITGNSGKMKLTFKSYDLQLRHVFTIANSSRKTTPVVLTEIEYEGVTGYGEASLPPYLGETQASVIEFLKKTDLSRFSNPLNLEDILTDIDKITENNTAAKAAVDIALHDLVGKLMGQPWY
ncbi:MAG: twin-arginine translocation signal domain-containing protein, partial [Tannerella sp.]|nr:twin-arginine translocation signal domain-containing protein [Tannerella sp.]